jgi:TPR repeat protein
MTLNISRFKPWPVLLFCGLVFAAPSVLAQEDGVWIAELKVKALSGDADSQYVLGNMHLLGDGVPKDDEAAVIWWTKSAEQGYDIAQLKLGLMYLNRIPRMGNLPVDGAKAQYWYALSAEQGNVYAQYTLAGG